MTLLNISGLSHHYAHGGFNGKHQHQDVDEAGADIMESSTDQFF